MMRLMHWTGLLPVLLISFVPMQASAQSLSLSLDTAFDQALNRNEITQQFEALRMEGISMEQIASRLPNPEFSFDQEEVSGGGSETTERVYALSQTLDISGERTFRYKAATAAKRAKQSEVALRAHDIRNEVRARYFEALYAQRQARTLDEWLERIASLTSDLRTQVERGEASRYDLQRLEQTRLGFSAMQSRAQATVTRQRARLLALVGLPVSSNVTLTEDLVPPPAPTLEALHEAAERHPELNMLSALSDEARFSARAERRAALPDLNVSLGVKTIRGTGANEDGYVLGLSVPLPLFDRRNGQTGIAAARAADRNAEYHLIRIKHLAEIEADRAAYVQLREHLLSQISAAETSAESLVTAAEAGYAGAEQSVLELADAYEVALNTLMDLLSMTFEARTAHSELVTHLHGDHPNDQ
ncbi:MAG: TolC family protein [Candidatus Thiodiazotropha weberae]|nr:TolC family protein [Candidatus Thiodiazotropha weberae]